MLYFACGPSLNAGDLRAWCVAHGVAYPLGPKIGNAWLPDREPCFASSPGGGSGGRLQLRPRVGQATPGALFEVDGEGLAVLDRREGVPGRSQRQQAAVLLEDGSAADVLLHTAAGFGADGGYAPPEEEDFRVLLEGLAAHGLPVAMHEAAARSMPVPHLVPLLFTYGTLRRGGRRHNLIASNLEELAPAVARGHLYDLGGYPGMVTDGKGGIVRGELCTLRDVSGALALLDRIEGFAGFGAEGSLFRRALVRAVTREGVESAAWAYLWARAPQGERIPSGDWLRR